VPSGYQVGERKVTQSSDFLDRFLARRNEDLRRSIADGDGKITDWMLNWHYQDQRDHQSYGEGQPHDFLDYEGPAQIAEWFGWMTRDPWPDYFPAELLAPLAQKSEALDREILTRSGIDFDFASYGTVGRVNAQDYLFQTMYPVPARNEISRILDFGAGWGRQSNLWSQQKSDDLVMVAMDAIPQSYCLQNFYFGANGLEFCDYIETGDLPITTDRPGLYHCPTWRWDLLPADFFDLVICSQVLPELSPDLARFAVKLFAQTLKPGGALFIRDHDSGFNPSGINLEADLQQAGFILEFRPHVIDRVDIHGIPRIWRKQDPQVMAAMIPA
jgi:SAM-dependent methyltransferase